MSVKYNLKNMIPGPVIDPDSETLRDLGTIGDCAEQTTSKINRNIERFTRMAKDYGWRRN